MCTLSIYFFMIPTFYLQMFHISTAVFPSSVTIKTQSQSKSTVLNMLFFYFNLQDFDFVLKGLARLLTNPLTQTYLPNSTKKIQFHQELLVLFWKLCDFNKVRN